MSFEPVFETINLTKRKENLTDQIKVECRTEISCESISKIINVSALANVLETESQSGSVKYGGKITFFICYEETDGELKKCECGAEFTGFITDSSITEVCKGLATAFCEKIEANLSGIKLSVTAFVKISASLSEYQKYTALSGGENIITDNQDFSYNRSFGTKKASYSIDEEFEVNYKVAEVLSQTTKSVVTSVQCGVGVIIVDGETYFTVIFLQNSEKRDIIRENKIIPFRMEIECEDAMPTFSATARVFDKSLKTEIAVDETNGVSVVSVSATLGFYGEAFSLESVNIARDAFSIEENLELSTDSIEYYKDAELISVSAKTNGKAPIDEITVGSYFCVAVGERAEVLSFEKTENGLNVVGTVTVNAIFCDGEGRFFSRRAETSFERSLDCVLPAISEASVSVVPKTANFKVVSLNEGEIECELAFTVYPREKTVINCIKEVVGVGEKSDTVGTVSVYIPMPNEELWSLSKRLNVCPSSLVATNRELQFPLTGKERIVVYRNH